MCCMRVGAAGNAGTNIVLNFPLSHGSEADMKTFEKQLNEFLISTNNTLLGERNKVLRDLRAGTKITNVEQFKNYFQPASRKDPCDTAAQAGKIVFDCDDGVVCPPTKRDWTCELLFLSFRHLREYNSDNSHRLTLVCSSLPTTCSVFIRLYKELS